VVPVKVRWHHPQLDDRAVMRLSLVPSHDVCCRVRSRVRMHQTNTTSCPSPSPISHVSFHSFVFLCRIRGCCSGSVCHPSCSTSLLSRVDGFYPSAYETLAVLAVDRHIAACPVLADVVQVKTGSSPTAHWSIDLDIDGIFQNWEYSHTSSLLPFSHEFRTPKAAEVLKIVLGRVAEADISLLQKPRIF